MLLVVDGVFYCLLVVPGAVTTKRRIWDHYLSFIEQRDNPNVLWVFYEDLLQDREKCIIKIAEFAGIPLDDELKAIVMEQSAFQFMKVCHVI